MRSFPLNNALCLQPETFEEHDAPPAVTALEPFLRGPLRVPPAGQLLQPANHLLAVLRPADGYLHPRDTFVLTVHVDPVWFEDFAPPLRLVYPYSKATSG